MREFLRNHVSRRLCAQSEKEIAVLATSMRQLGVGSQGGAEALAILHQLIHDEWTSGTQKLTNNWFGMIERSAVRKVTSSLLPSMLQWQNGKTDA